MLAMSTELLTTSELGTHRHNAWLTLRRAADKRSAWDHKYGQHDGHQERIREHRARADELEDEAEEAEFVMPLSFSPSMFECQSVTDSLTKSPPRCR
jgi:hypothetical protein